MSQATEPLLRRKSVKIKQSSFTPKLKALLGRLALEHGPFNQKQYRSKQKEISTHRRYYCCAMPWASPTIAALSRGVLEADA